MDGEERRKARAGGLIAIYEVRIKKEDVEIPLLFIFALAEEFCGDSRPRLSAGRSPALLRPRKTVELRSPDSRGRLSPHDYAAFAMSRKLFTLSCAACTLAACRRTICAISSGKSPVTAF